MEGLTGIAWQSWKPQWAAPRAWFLTSAAASGEEHQLRFFMPREPQLLGVLLQVPGQLLPHRAPASLLRQLQRRCQPRLAPVVAAALALALALPRSTSTWW